MEFESLFAAKAVKVKVKRNTVSFEKKAKVTKILLPTDFTSTKGKITPLVNENGEVCLVELKDGLSSVGAASYNVVSNSINSKPIADAILSMFNCEEFVEFDYELITGEFYGIKITGIHSENEPEVEIQEPEEVEPDSPEEFPEV